MGSSSGDTPDSLRSWVIAGTGAVAMVFTFGTPFSYGVFLGPFSETFGISTVVLSTVFSIMLSMFFVGSGVIGVVSARLPIRALIGGCVVMTALLTPSLYVVDSYVGLTVVFALVGMALGTMYVVLAALVPQWFDAHTGRATGIIFAGNGLGLFVLPPVWQYAIGRLGVRAAFVAVMAATTLVFLVSLLVCRRPTWSDPATASTLGMAKWASGMLGTRRVKLLFLGVGLSMGWYMMLPVYVIDLFAVRGLTEAGASAAFGLIGGVSILSRLGSGVAADVAGFRRTYLASGLCAIGGIGLLFAPVFAAMAVSVFLMGIGLGGLATMYIPLILGTYSEESQTAVVGIFNVALGVVALVVPPTGAAIISYTGSFTGAILFSGALLCGAVSSMLLGTRS
jgi:MFS family permease